MTDYERDIPRSLTSEEKKIHKRVNILFAGMCICLIIAALYGKVLTSIEQIRNVYVVQTISKVHINKMRFKLEGKEYYLRLNIKDRIRYDIKRDYYELTAAGEFREYYITYNLYEVEKRHSVGERRIILDVVNEDNSFMLYNHDGDDVMWGYLYYILDAILDAEGYRGNYKEAQVSVNGNKFDYLGQQTHVGKYVQDNIYEDCIVSVVCDNMDFGQEGVIFNIKIEDL